jgi:uncharacterized protein (TIGR00725 family)
MKERKKIQIGVIGPANSLGYDKKLELLAIKLGEEIARAKAIIIYGVEKDQDSLPAIACRAARKIGGTTVGITYENYGAGAAKNLEFTDVIIYTGLVRGGGRELVLALSCDGIISINGGGGTLTEITIAYQAKIPVVALENSGGWSEKLAGTYLDERKREVIFKAKDAASAVKLLIKKIKKYKKIK